MRFEVPQFIEVEDKMFGPLTWRQFIYVGGGVGFAVVLFFTTPILVFSLFGIPAAGLGFLLGFYPVNNRPFSIFLQSMLGYFGNTRLYLWRKKGTGVYNDNEDFDIGSLGELHIPQDTSNLTTTARNLDFNTSEQ